jgi:hypothetical protein
MATMRSGSITYSIAGSLPALPDSFVSIPDGTFA